MMEKTLMKRHQRFLRFLCYVTKKSLRHTSALLIGPKETKLLAKPALRQTSALLIGPKETKLAS